jgi:hypothetical protein
VRTSPVDPAGERPARSAFASVRNAIQAVIQTADGSLHEIHSLWAERTGPVVVCLGGLRAALTKSAAAQPQSASAASPRLTI